MWDSTGSGATVFRRGLKRLPQIWMAKSLRMRSSRGPGASRKNWRRRVLSQQRWIRREAVPARGEGFVLTGREPTPAFSRGSRRRYRGQDVYGNGPSFVNLEDAAAKDFIVCGRKGLVQPAIKCRGLRPRIRCARESGALT